MLASTIVEVVALHRSSGGAEEVLRAPVRGKVVEVTGVLGHLHQIINVTEKDEDVNYYTDSLEEGLVFFLPVSHPHSPHYSTTSS